MKLLRVQCNRVAQHQGKLDSQAALCDKSKVNAKSYDAGFMRAALFYGAGDVRLSEVEIPVPLSNEVVIKVEAALTCGSDLKAFRQGHPVLLGNQYPAPFGHEVAGHIHARGSEVVSSFKVGQRVVAANSAPCDTCFYCDRGEPNLCDNLALLNGAYAEYIRIPAQIVKHNLYTVPEHLPLKYAALSEPLACSLHAFDRLGIQRQDTVVIYGAGIMGLLFASVAKHAGARIIAVGRNEKKLNKAKLLGCDEIIDVGQTHNLPAEVKRLTEDRGADVVLEAIGRPESWTQAFAMVRKGGTVCLFGGCKKGSSFALDTHQTHYDEITVKGIFHHRPQYFAQALHYLAEGFVKGELFIDGEVLLEDLSQYYAEHLTKSFEKYSIHPHHRK